MASKPTDGGDSTQMVGPAGRPTAPPAEDTPYLIVLAGAGAGEIFPVDRTITLGRDDQADIRLPDDGVSRRHARIVTRSVGLFLTDLGSTNGTLLNGVPVTDPIRLKDGDKISVGATTILKFTYHDRFEDEFQQGLFNRVRRDPLTGVWKRKYFDEHLLREFAYARRHSTELSLLMLDIDHFTLVNDTWGHVTGDMVLITLARRIQATLRTEDFFARYGGEEFVILCRSTDGVQGTVLAERVCALIGREPFILSSLPKPLAVTVSVGISVYASQSMASPTDLLDAADHALSAAKTAGRNRVIVADPDAT